MLPEKIIIQSAGSFSITIIALLMFVFQTILYVRKRPNKWHAWSAAISFSALLYAFAIFIEYNTVAGALNRLSGQLEWVALILLIHSMFGFTFSYLKADAGKYHVLAGGFHVIVIMLIMNTNYIVAEEFSYWNFLNLSTTYVEPALGPFGFFFVIYIATSAVWGMIIWLRHRSTEIKYRIIFLSGMGAWLLLGIHDGLVCLGIRSIQYIMEYGFLGFSLSVLWVEVASHIDTETDEKYQVITEYAGEVIIIVQDKKIVFGNPAFWSLTGNASGGCPTAAFSNMMLPEDRALYKKIYDSILSGNKRTDRHTVCVRRSETEKLFLDIVVSSIKYRGRLAVLGVMRDITRQKLEEESLRLAEEKVTRLKKMESLGLLAGGVAHDLNNVLSGIVNYPELMMMEMSADCEYRKPLEEIMAAGFRAVAIVQDLLTVARGVAIKKVSLTVNEVVLDYLNSPELEKLKKHHPDVTITANLMPELSAINASPIHIRKTIMNLVSNASEAIEGSGKVIVSTENCQLEQVLQIGYETVPAGDYVLVSVSDNGPGISQSDMERIFEPFYTKKVMGRSGTGLGLAVVWNIIQDHNGFIDVITSEKGSSFKLYFPVDERGSKADIPLAPLSDYKGNGETILIVDDMEQLRNVTLNMLKQLGYNPVAVPGGEDAIEYMKEHSADLMLIDMIMDPGINGRQTYEKIIELHPGQKAVIASGFAETDDVKQTMALGAGKFVKKPFSLHEIGKAIKEELARSSRPGM